jgi:hypothetical protein
VYSQPISLPLIIIPNSIFSIIPAPKVIPLKFQQPNFDMMILSEFFWEKLVTNVQSNYYCQI